MNLPPLDLTLELIAAYAANEYIEAHCFGMMQEERLATWKRVNDTLIAALTYQREALNCKRREVLHHASAN